MIIDASHRRWCIATLFLFLLSSGVYLVYARSAPGGPRGGSVPGMLYGIAGSALMFYAGLISARKKLPTWRIGSAQTWLRGHIWLGLLSVPLVLFHAGFRWGGLLEQVLLSVLAAIVVSGLIGLAVQQFLPRQMTARVPLETFYAQLPFECRLLQVEGDVAVAAVCGPLSVSPDIDVATQPRLKAMGVMEKKGLEKKPREKEMTATEKEREKHHKLLAMVYRPPGTEEPPRATAADQPQAVALEPPPPPEEAKEASEPKKPLTASDKIARMRAAKRSTPPADKSASAEEESRAAETGPPKPQLSAAEKIALMRAGANAPVSLAPTSSEKTPVVAEGRSARAGPNQPLSAADKIALMRGGKGKSADVASASSGVMDPAVPSAGKAPQAVWPTQKPLDPLARQRGSDELARFYLESVRPFLDYRMQARSALSNEVEAGGVFAAVRAGLADDLRLALDRLADLCEKRRQLSVQEGIHRWLHGWLFVHVPLSLALLGLGVVHAVLSLYY